MSKTVVLESSEDGDNLQEFIFLISSWTSFVFVRSIKYSYNMTSFGFCILFIYLVLSVFTSGPIS
jgi:hypothetical protein